MNNLKNIHTKDLIDRWNMIIDDYLNRLKNIKIALIKINKIRNELILINKELLERNIDVEFFSKEEKVDCPEEHQKI